MKLHLLGLVHTSNQSSNHSPSTINAAISIWSPSNMTINLSSPNKSDQFYWIYLAIAYSGWSKVTTGVYPGFSISTDAVIMFKEWRIIANELLFWDEYQKYFIECVENIRIFTSAKHEWKFWCFQHPRWNIFGIYRKKVNFLFILYVTLAMYCNWTADRKCGLEPIHYSASDDRMTKAKK